MAEILNPEYQEEAEETNTDCIAVFRTGNGDKRVDINFTTLRPAVAAALVLLVGQTSKLGTYREILTLIRSPKEFEYVQAVFAKAGLDADTLASSKLCNAARLSVFAPKMLTFYERLVNNPKAYKQSTYLLGAAGTLLSRGLGLILMTSDVFGATTTVDLDDEHQNITNASTLTQAVAAQTYNSIDGDFVPLQPTRTSQLYIAPVNQMQQALTFWQESDDYYMPTVWARMAVAGLTDGLYDYIGAALYCKVSVHILNEFLMAKYHIKITQAYYGNLRQVFVMHTKAELNSLPLVKRFEAMLLEEA